MSEREDDIIGVPELAAIIKRPEGTLRQWRHRGYGPRSFRIGGRIGYRRSDVEAWLRAQEAATAVGDAGSAA